MPLNIFALCCRHTNLHITSALIPEDYIQAIWEDNLEENRYVIVKRSQAYNLPSPQERGFTARVALGLMRYLSTHQIPVGT